MLNRILILLVIFSSVPLVGACPVFEGQVFSRILGSLDYANSAAQFSHCKIKVVDAHTLQIESVMVFKGRRIQSWQKVANHLEVGPAEVSLGDVLKAAPLERTANDANLNSLRMGSPPSQTQLTLPLWTKRVEYDFSADRHSERIDLLKSDDAGNGQFRNSAEVRQLIRWIEDLCGTQEFYEDQAS